MAKKSKSTNKRKAPIKRKAHSPVRRYVWKKVYYKKYKPK